MKINTYGNSDWVHRGEIQAFTVTNFLNYSDPCHQLEATCNKQHENEINVEYRHPKPAFVCNYSL